MNHINKLFYLNYKNLLISSINITEPPLHTPVSIKSLYILFSIMKDIYQIFYII
jgi:hypothetical protein